MHHHTHLRRVGSAATVLMLVLTHLIGAPCRTSRQALSITPRR